MVGRIRAEERGSGLGSVSGKQDKEKEKTAEEGLPKNIWKPLLQRKSDALHFFVAGKNQREYSGFVLVKGNLENNPP